MKFPYIVCERNGVGCRSQKYLNSYVEGRETGSITRTALRVWERLVILSVETGPWIERSNSKRSMGTEFVSNIPITGCLTSR